MRVHWKRVIAVVATGAFLCVASFAQEKAAAQAKQESHWKDRAEYDLVISIQKETNPTTRLSLLDQWKQKYPNTYYEMNRLKFYLVTYQELKEAPKMLETCKAILAKDPADMQGLYWSTLLPTTMKNASPADLDTAFNSAKALLQNLDKFFAASAKPPQTTEAAWTKEKTNVEGIAENTIGWVAMQRKDNATAEKAFKEVLRINPNNAQASYWLGTVILAQRNPEKQAAGLYYLARASQYTGEGELQPAVKKQISEYLDKVYTNYHGSRDGLDQILARAKTDPEPPAGFRIQSAAEVEIAKKEALRQNNPMLYLWEEVIKGPLMKPDGEAYFNAQVKDHVLPGNVEGVSKLRGRVVSQNPPTRPTEVYLSITPGSSSPEVLLKLDGPMRLPAPIGSTISFEGPVRSFTTNPRFLLVFEVERDKIGGWPKVGGVN